MSLKNKAISYRLEKKTLMSLGVLIVGLSIIYSYFVMLSVSHVVLREEIAFENLSLSDEVSKLEIKYLAVSNQLTESKAISMGYRTTKAKTFVERGSYSLNSLR